MNANTRIYYRGAPIARPVRRHDRRWEARTRIDQAPFGPSWSDTPEGWDAAAQWFETTGHTLGED